LEDFKGFNVAHGNKSDIL